MSAANRFLAQSIPAQFLLICIFATALRLSSIAAQSFWTDEVLTIKISPQPWKQLIASLKTDESCKPPFYYALMHFWLGKNPDETSARIPSAIFGALSCGILLLVGEQLLGKKKGWIPAMMLALSPFHLWYSQEARMYTLWLFLNLIALYFYLKYRREPRIVWLLIFALSATLCCYTFTYGFFLLAWIGFAALVDSKNFTRPALIKLFVTLFLSFLLFTPWLWQMMHLASAAGVAQFNKGSSWLACAYTFFVLGYGLTLGPTQEQLRLLGAGFFKEHPGDAAWIALLITAVIVLLMLGFKAARKDRHFLALTLGGLAIFWVGPAVISFLRPNVTYNPRYALVALVPFLLLLSAAIPSLLRMRIGLICLCLFCVGIVMSDFNYFYATQYQRDNLAAATAYIMEKNCPFALVSATFAAPVVNYYGHGRIEALAYPPKNHAYDELNPSQPLWQDLENRGRFAWVYTRPDHWDPKGRFPQWLQKNFHIIESSHWTGVTVFICVPRQLGIPSLLEDGS
jgi:mannosyltransferase